MRKPKERRCILCGKTLRPDENGARLQTRQEVTKAPTLSGHYSLFFSISVEADSDDTYLCDLCFAASSGVIAGTLCKKFMRGEEDDDDE